MKRIFLTQGKFTTVDDADFEWLNQHGWYANKNRHSFYVARMSTIQGHRIVIKMHREILGLKRGDGKHTDHIDGNGLNNQRSNLRICTNQQNQFNQKAQRNNSSRFKGVYWAKEIKKWVAQIKYNQKAIYLGSFNSESGAARAYNKKAKELFGEFAYRNLL